MLLHSIQDQWHQVRTAVATDDTGDDLLGDDTKYFAFRGDNEYVLPLGCNGCMLAFVGQDSSDNDAEALTFTTNVYLRGEKGPAQFVYTATYTIGAQGVIEAPWDKGAAHTGQYADTVASVTDVWIKTVTFANSGNDGICVALFDALGRRNLRVEIENLGANLSVTPIVCVI